MNVTLFLPSLTLGNSMLLFNEKPVASLTHTLAFPQRHGD